MGSYTFKWEHPAEEVYVTGTFDTWTKSVQLEKKGDVFEKTVDLPDASKKIYYKFVVDNNWVINESSPKEPDDEGNVNNFLTPEQIFGSGISAAVLNTVAPESTTTKMAGEQPLEKDTEVPTPYDVPGGFPVTPANELDKTFGVAPLPAADGAVNPITLAPGDPIPNTITSQSVDEHVKLDKESYEKSDALGGVDMSLPPVTSNTIPEAGLPITDNKPVTISTVGPGATTAALAGAVPLESKVPEVVKDSQEAAGVAPEASANPVEVEEKAQLESELKAKVPEAPSTSEGIPELGTVKSENDGAITGTVAAAGASVAAAAMAAASSVVTNATPAVTQATTAATVAANNNLPDSVKQQLPVAAQDALASHNKETTREEVSPAVPAEVKQSIIEAGKGPEAAANTDAVATKEVMESELLKEVSEAPAVGETSITEAKKETTANKADIKAEKAESKLQTEAVKSNLKAEEEKTKVEKAEIKDATADTKKEKVAAKAEKVEAKAEAKAQDAKAAVAGTAASKTEEKHAEKKEEKAANGSESKAANGSESKPAQTAGATTTTPATTTPAAASSSKPAEASVEQKKKNRLSSMFSKLKSKMK